MRSVCRLAVVVLLWSIAAASAHALDFVVDSTLDMVDASPGDAVCATSSVPAKCTLRAAIMEANAHAGLDRVLLAAETYTLSISGRDEDDCETGDLDVRDSIEISGAGATMTTVDGAGIDRVFDATGLSVSESVTFADLTIAGGAATTTSTYSGGGINASDGYLWLIRVHVVGNAANYGAGLHVSFGSAVVIQSTITGNSIVEVGATNPYGNAILIEKAGAVLNLDSSTVTGNLGGWTSIMGLQGASILVRSSTVSDNDGVAVRNYNGDLEISSSTILYNHNDGVSFGSFDGDDTITIYDSIIAGHELFGWDNCVIPTGTYIHAGNLESTNVCGFGAGEIVNSDPMVGPLASNGGPTQTYQLRPGSPAIDGGVDGSPYCTNLDQRGVQRPRDGDGDGVAHCDIGAVETGMPIFADGFETGDPSHWS